VLSSGLPIVVSGFNAILNLASNLAIVLFVAVFFLVDPVSYVKASLYLVPKHNRPRMVEIWNELYQTIDLWLQAQFSSILITVVLVWAVLGGILNMPNSLTVAVIAGFATFVPNIGAFLPIIPIIIFQLADDPARLVIVLPAYLIIQLLESNVLTPTIVRAELDIPSGALMIFQVVAAFLFGAMGVLLAVPLLAILITLVREIYSFDLLQLRHQPVSLGWNEAGKMVLIERTEDIEATDHSDE
jgi:predicted PurR-regulated permease PerM